MGDIYLSILFGLKTKSDYYKAIKQSGELDFEMEDLNIMIGEAEDAFFTRDDFQKNQVIKTAFIMPLPKDIIGHKKLNNRPKRPNEYRILFIDYAFANTTGKSENDNTIIGCMYGIYEDKIMKRGVEYLTTHEASDTLGTANLIRQLFWLYHCDYIVLDLRNGGEIHYNLLTQQYDDLGYPNWNYHGFTVVNDDSLNVVPRNKIDDLISRTIDPQAIPCIIPIVATADFNSLMWLEMKKQLQNENVSFLIDDMEYEQLLNTRNDYFKLTSEEKADLKYPYSQIMLLINEAVNLSQEWKDGRVKLEEPRTGTKDRIVACSYGNYFLTLLENKLAQKEQSKDDDIDWDNISLVV